MYGISPLTVWQCQDHLPSQCKEPLISKPLPERPFQEIAADIGSFAGWQYLIVVDCKTDWLDIIDLRKDTTACVTPNRIFARLILLHHSARSTVVRWWTTVYIVKFSRNVGYCTPKLILSPHYPQSNGKAKVTVKSMKKLISSAWTGRSVDWKNFIASYCSIATLPAVKMVFPLHRNCLDTQSRIIFQPTGALHTGMAKGVKTIRRDTWIISQTGWASLQWTCSCNGRTPHWQPSSNSTPAI